jgi:hypothetical protein
MSGRSKRLSQALCAVLANRQQSVGKIVALLATHSIEPLANGRRNSCSQGFSGALRELFRQSMRLRVLDIQSHSYTILPLSYDHSTIARFGRQESLASEFWREGRMGTGVSTSAEDTLSTVSIVGTPRSNGSGGIRN